jgi:hypothetical protein
MLASGAASECSTQSWASTGFSLGVSRGARCGCYRTRQRRWMFTLLSWAARTTCDSLKHSAVIGDGGLGVDRVRFGKLAGRAAVSCCSRSALWRRPRGAPDRRASPRTPAPRVPFASAATPSACSIPCFRRPRIPPVAMLAASASWPASRCAAGQLDGITSQGSVRIHGGSAR